MRRAEQLANSDSTAVLPVAVITLVWLVGLVVLLAQREAMVAAGRGWWLWAAGAGLLTGVLALIALRRRARRLASRARAD